jgi:hypothetical protein
MRKIITLTLLGASLFSYAGTNLSDAIDANEVPAENEERVDETINRPDVLDQNFTPSTLEEREKQEEWREDYEGDQFDTKKRQNQEDIQ